MAIGTAALTVTVSETLTLNGVEVGGTNSLVIDAVNDFYKRIITVPAATETTLYTTHDTAVGGSQFDDDLVKYVRITNKDATVGGYCRLRVSNTANDEFVYTLNQGESFLLYSHSNAMNANEAGVASLGGTAEITDITANTDAVVDLEIFVASI